MALDDKTLDRILHRGTTEIVVEEEFVRLMLEEIPVPPLDAARIRATNLGLEPA